MEARLVGYQTHVQDIGTQDYVYDGAMAGTSGQAKRMEFIRIKLPSTMASEGKIEYKSHIENIGWENSWKQTGELSGTSGKSLRLEAIQIKLSGDIAEKYDVYYRVHAENFRLNLFQREQKIRNFRHLHLRRKKHLSKNKILY